MIFTVAESVGFLAIWWFFFVLYRDYRVDSYRQKLFKLRDQLFDFAAEGQIPFSHDAYGMLRSTINGSIRHGHRVGPIYLFAMACVRKESAPKLHFEQRWQKALSTLEPEVRKKMECFRTDLHAKLLIQLLLTSPLFLLPATFLLLFGLIAIALSAYIGGKLRVWMNKKIEKVFSIVDRSAWQEAQA